VPPDPAVASEPGFARALRSRNYRLFFAGQWVSLIGTWMQSVAQSWLVYRLTGSTALLGMMGFAGQIPVLFVAPFGGAIADRVARRTILLVTQTTQMLLAFALAALTLSGEVRVPHLFVLAVCLGVANAIDIPTRQAFVVEMVGHADLPNAIALNSSMVNGARMVGPAIAGIVVAAIGEGWCFLVNGVSFLAVIAGLLAMTGLLTPPRREPKSPLRDIVEGFSFVGRHGPIRSLLLLLGSCSLFGMPFVVLLPVYADQILGGGARTLGLLTGASGVGAITGALTLAQRRETTGMERWIAAGALVFGASLVGFAFSRTFLLSELLLAIGGAAMMIQIAGSNTLIQTMVPDALRGRVMSVHSMMFLGMSPFGALAAGAFATRIGTPVTIALGGTACAAGSAAFALYLSARPFPRG
jgi:MFS family permease